MIHSMFLCHGAPDIVLEGNEYTRLLQEMGKNIKPKVIVNFTAHWENEITTISSIEGKYDMIYDFYGFPKELYAKQYPANGSPEYAKKVKDLLESSNIPAKLDTSRGIDHGTWALLYIMYPEANIPVVQVSVNPFRPMEEQFAIGEALKSLGEEDVLIIGSGSTVHNLATLDGYAKEPKSWAVEFDDWLIDKVLKKDMKALYSYQSLAPNAHTAVPREEHITPMFIAMGSGTLEAPRLIHRSYAYGTLTYLGFEF